MQEQLMKRVAVYSVIFGVLTMGAMLYFLSVKTIVIADELVADGEEVSKSNEPKEWMELFFSKDDINDTYLNIPLSQEIRADNITIENNIMEQQIQVFIKGLPEGFYKDFELTGNYNRIMDGKYSYKDGVTQIQLQLSGIYEQEYIFENNILKLQFVEPKELYDKIVVLDTESAESLYDRNQAVKLVNEITLDISRKISDKLKENNIKVYCTNEGMEKATKEQRLKVVNNSGADLAVSIYINADFEEPSTYGTEVICNKDYFIPEFGSVQLADLLERELVTHILGKANGLRQAKEESLIKGAKIPAAQVLVGYLSNEKERTLLMEEEYRTKIAEGIYQGILKAFEEIN